MFRRGMQRARSQAVADVPEALESGAARTARRDLRGTRHLAFWRQSAGLYRGNQTRSRGRRRKGKEVGMTDVMLPKERIFV